MRLKSRMLGCLSALALCVGLALMAAPGSALATTKCANWLASGSSLQFEQQSLWTKHVEGSTSLAGCETGSTKPAIDYLSTSSGKGLSEFGANEKEALLVKESGNGAKLDAFVGTDDPPTHEELLHIEKAGGTGSKPLVIPIVAAPVAIILHPPKACDVLGANGLIGLLPLTLSHVFSRRMTWSHFLLLINEHLEELKKKLVFTESTGCGVHVLVEVRSDSSGTSFALKQFLCQVLPAVWTENNSDTEANCQSGVGLVTDAPTWPGGSEGPLIDKEHHGGLLNEGSKGEAAAVELTEGSIGYVNAANAVAQNFSPFGEAAKQSLLLFWVPVNNQEPITGTGTSANCPTTYTFKGNEETEAKNSEWSKIHLAKPGETSHYPICTFTYDIAWGDYETGKLEESNNYGSVAKAEEVGNTTKGYFEYEVGGGQSALANDYGALPSGNLLTVAKNIASKVG